MNCFVEKDFIPLVNEPVSDDDDDNDDNDDEANGYQSDEIDQEIEHRLYSFIHHRSWDQESSLEIFSQDKKDSSSNLSKISESTMTGLNNHKNNLKFKSLKVNTLKTFQNGGNYKINIKSKVKPSKISKENSSKTDSYFFKKNNVISHFILHSHDKHSGDDNNDRNVQNSNNVNDNDDDDSSGKEDIGGNDDYKSEDWKVDLKDKQFSGRYYRSSKFCTHCKKYGNHAVKGCSLLKKNVCYFCCAFDHIGSNCPNRYCNRCMDFHQLKGCCSNYHNLICHVCNLYGHIGKYCPNNWRKFFNTTQFGIDPSLSQSNLNITKNKRKFCGNCGLSQHFTYECSTFFKENNFIPNSPYVYETRSRYSSTQKTKLSNGFTSKHSESKSSKKKRKVQKKDIKKKCLENRKAEIRAKKKARREQVKEIREIFKKAKKAEKLKKKKQKFKKKNKEKSFRSKNDQLKPHTITID